MIKDSIAILCRGESLQHLEELPDVEEYLIINGFSDELEIDFIKERLTGKKINHILSLGCLAHPHPSGARHGCFGAMLEKDHFKKFNDQYGHLVGDLILKRLGKLFKEELPIPCEGFRFGGEEFMILMPQCNKERAMDVAESIRVGVSKLRFKSAKTRERLPKMTITLGVTEWQAEDELEHVIMRADQALYEAKNNGRNQVRHAQ